MCGSSTTAWPVVAPLELEPRAWPVLESPADVLPKPLPLPRPMLCFAGVFSPVSVSVSVSDAKATHLRLVVPAATSPSSRMSCMGTGAGSLPRAWPAFSLYGSLPRAWPAFSLRVDMVDMVATHKQKQVKASHEMKRKQCLAKIATNDENTITRATMTRVPRMVATRTMMATTAIVAAA